MILCSVTLFFSWAGFESSVKFWLDPSSGCQRANGRTQGCALLTSILNFAKKAVTGIALLSPPQDQAHDVLHLSSFLQMSYIFQSPPVANLPSRWDCPHLFPIGLCLLHQLNFPQPLPSSSPSTPCWETPARNIPFTFWISLRFLNLSTIDALGGIILSCTLWNV